MNDSTSRRRSGVWLWGGAGVVLALVAAAALLAATGRWKDVENLPVRLATRWVAPQAGDVLELDGRERRALRRLGQSLEGRIIWSSNRSGNHEIYLLELGDSDPVARRLTDHPHVDFSSRFSPDGQWIVFARSQREWVSFREVDAWDLYLMRADGSEQRQLVRHGYHPTWARGGRSVVFQRGAQVVEVDVESGAESVLFDADTVLEGRGWGEQALHEDRSLLGLAVQGAGVIVVPPGANEFRHLTLRQACQTSWVPGTRELLWVDAEGNGGTRIVRGSADRPVDEGIEVVMDLPGERSHEYFPTLSDDGQWLVWGASAEGHEHDRADYEIYVWKVGTPWEEATRITYYTGNDQWPDVHVDERS